MTTASATPELAAPLKPLAWLLGKWLSTEAEVIYPTMSPFKYTEELEFSHCGQPNIQFTFYSYHPEKKKPMHRETGFIRINPNSNEVALIISMNIGVCEIEEGTLEGQTMKTETTSMASISFGKEPRTKKLFRTFQLENDDTLQQVVYMETSTTPKHKHVTAKYQRVTV